MLRSSWTTQASRDRICFYCRVKLSLMRLKASLQAPLRHQAKCPFCFHFQMSPLILLTPVGNQSKLWTDGFWGSDSALSWDQENGDRSIMAIFLTEPRCGFQIFFKIVFQTTSINWLKLEPIFHPWFKKSSQTIAWSGEGKLVKADCGIHLA